MSFRSPLILLALLALPVLVAFYRRAQLRRRVEAAAFATAALEPSVAPRRPGWRRHVPMAAALLALAALVVAAAKPQRTVAVPVEHASVMLATALMTYSMTRSARSRSDPGIVSPSALAVLRLITMSNFLGCSTGRSPGLAPLRILSTYAAA